MKCLTILTIGLLIVDMTALTETIALAPLRRIAAYRSLSAVRKNDAMSKVLSAGYVNDVKRELEQLSKVSGMRAVYNELETVCVIDKWIAQKADKCLQNRPDMDQIVVINAGMGSLPYCLEASRRCTVFEIDSAVVFFMKKHLINMSPEKVRMYAHWLHYCPCTIDNHTVMNDGWFDSLQDAGWDQSATSLFIMQDTADELKLESVEHVLLTALHRTKTGSVVIFNTGRMLDERRRVENWLMNLGYTEFEIDLLSDKKIHEGVLSIHDPGFTENWLVCCSS